MGEIMTYEERQQSLMAFLKAKANIIKALVPRHQDARRLAMIVHQSVQRTPALLDCSFDSLVGSILECFRLGLEPGGIGGEAYLIPLKDRGVMKANLWMGYKGLCRLAYNSGQVGYISAEAVYEGDEFSYELGTSPHVTHKPCGVSDPAKITHFYAILHLRDSHPVFKVMTDDEVLKVKNRSRAGGNGPWVTDYAAMGCKTVIKRVLRTAPLSQELQQAIGFDDLAEVGKDQGVEQVWDVPVEVVDGDPAAAPSPEFIKFIRSLRSQWMKKIEASWEDFQSLAASTLGDDRAPDIGGWDDKPYRDQAEPKWLMEIGKADCKKMADRLKELLGMED